MIRQPALLLLCAGLAAAQEPEEHAPPLERPIVERLLPEVTSRLRSDKPGSVAWGAYLAGRFRLTEALREIRKALERDYGSDAEGWLTRLHLLDALVRLDGTLSTDALSPHLSGPHLAPALILTARNPAANRKVLRELFEKHSGPRGNPFVWRATGNLLASLRAPGFAEHLLETTAFELHVVVTDRADMHFGFGGRVGGAFADGRMEVPAAFPPTPRYELVEDPESGDVLLAHGPVSVYWRRTERTERQFGVGGRRPRMDQRPDNLRWLDTMADREVFGPDLPIVSRRTVLFEGAEQYAAEVDGLRKEIHVAFTRALERLVDTSVLTGDEARGVALDLRTSVHDQRQDKSIDLPPIK